jgi:hypothetical protein
MPIQKCPMCLETKNVVSSHLYPAALYAYCRAADDSGPVRVGDGFIMHTDRQMQHPLLCVECEQILNKGGEMWVNPKLATVKQGFPLYDILMKGSAAFQDEAGGIYFAAENPHIDIDKLAHFSMGIFWKAAVHSWKAKERKPMIALGPYADTIRIWLRAESPFPKNVALSVMLARPNRAVVAFTGPVERRTKGWRTFWLYVPGVSFTLSVGRLIESEMRETCVHESATHPIFVSDDVMGVVWKRLREQYQESRRTKGYLEAKARRSLKQDS